MDFCLCCFYRQKKICVCNFQIAKSAKSRIYEYAPAITANKLNRILFHMPLSFYLFFRKRGYYETVNIIGLKYLEIQYVVLEKIPQQSTVMRLDCVYSSNLSFPFKAIISPLLITSLQLKKKKITINIHSLFAGFEHFFNPTSYFTLHNRCGLSQ